jgi:hypothetical protein
VGLRHRALDGIIRWSAGASQRGQHHQENWHSKATTEKSRRGDAAREVGSFMPGQFAGTTAGSPARRKPAEVHSRADGGNSWPTARVVRSGEPAVIGAANRRNTEVFLRPLVTEKTRHTTCQVKLGGTARLCIGSRPNGARLFCFRLPETKKTSTTQAGDQDSHPGRRTRTGRMLDAFH